ncbi:hypothetical protein C0J52_05301 [Blattella germanica]|nr:hypothetical protein C0J52_05301 [Blattella germanica]
MHILRSNTRKLRLELMTNDGNLEEVAEFKYLGALIINRNEIQKEIKHWLLSKNIKLKIHKTVILPVILYGCETWILTLREEKILRVFENRRGRGELRWAGHVVRMGNERGMRRIHEGKPEGKRPVGRPRMKWENNRPINHDMREVDYTGDDWKTLAQDRDV